VPVFFDQRHTESNKGSRGRTFYYPTFGSFVSWVFYVGVSFCIILSKKKLHLATTSFFLLKAHKTTRVQRSLLDFDGFLLIQKVPSVFYLGGTKKNISFRHCFYCATYLQDSSKPNQSHVYFFHCYNIDGTPQMPFANAKLGQTNFCPQQLAIQSTD
jgi:hypothetical protein